MKSSFLTIGNIFITISYFDVGLLLFLILIGKTRDFLFLLEFLQQLCLLKYINFYSGIGYEQMFDHLEIFCGKFLKIKNSPFNDSLENLPVKLRIIANADITLVNNIGEILMILIIVILFLVFLHFLHISCYVADNSFISTIYKKLKWSFFILFFEFTSIPILFFCCLEISVNEFKNANNYANAILASFVLFFFGIGLFMIIKTINYDGKSSSVSFKDYMEQYESLFERLNLKGILSRNYIPIRIFFHILECLLIVCLMFNFRYQLISLMMIFLIKILFVVVLKPFQSFVINFLEICNFFILFMIYTFLLYSSFHLINLNKISIFFYGLVTLGVYMNSIPIILSISQNYQQIKNIFLGLYTGEYKFGLKRRIKNFFIDFEEKHSQNTKPSINNEQKQYNAFFMNPSPELSEQSQEIAKIPLENYVQTEIKENEKFENREMKKKIVKLSSKSFTFREPDNHKNEVKNKCDLSFTQRIKDSSSSAEIKSLSIKNKIKTERTFKI